MKLQKKCLNALVITILLAITGSQTVIAQYASKQFQYDDFINSEYLKKALLPPTLKPNRKHDFYQQDNMQFELVGKTLHGSCYSVFVQDQYAYFGIGSSLIIYDISNIQQPNMIGSITTHDQVYKILVNNNYAYITNGDCQPGLCIVDISDRTNPVEIGFLSCASQYFWRIDLQGNYLYVTSDIGLHIIDVSIPQNPIEMAMYDNVGEITSVLVSGNRAYVTARDSGLMVLDISNIMSISKLGSINIPEAFEIDLVGNYAYVAANGLHIINVSDPSNLREIGSYTEPSSCRYLEVVGSTAFLGGYNSLYIVNISEPTNPSKIGFLQIPAWSWDLAIQNNYAFLSCLWSGFKIVDISNLSNALIKTSNYTGGQFGKLKVNNEFAFVIDREHGLRIFDIKTPANPVEVCLFETDAINVAIKEPYVFLVGGLKRFQVLDVSDPHNVVEVGNYYSEYLNDIVIKENYAYVSYASGLSILDISAPHQPYELGFLDITGYSDIQCVAVKDNYVYLGTGKSRKVIAVDVTDPTKPFQIGSCNTSNYVFDIAVEGNFLYAAEGNGYDRVELISISNPRHPVVLSDWYAGDYFSMGIEARNSLAYVAVRYSGLYVVDFSVPTAPVNVGAYKSGGYNEDVALNDNYYFLVGDDGLKILKLKGANMPPFLTTLIQPANNMTLNSGVPLLRWNIPVDPDNDPLHFKVEISRNSSFTSPISGSPFESKQNASSFSPTPPLPSGTGTCSFTVRTALTNGDYWWRVSAWDGTVYGPASEAWKFTVSVTPVYLQPVVNDHNLHQEFYVDIQIKDAQNLFGVAFKLNFPADKLEALSAEKGDFLGADPVFFPDINNSTGVVSVGVSKKSGQPAANGAGIVARIKLKEKSSVTSGIIIELSLTEVAANDPSGNPITLTPQNTSYVTPGVSATLDVSPTSLTLGSAANSQGSFSVTSNVNWSVSKDATWLTVSPTSGSGNGTITVTANSANSSANPRSATVTVSGSGISRTVVVTQSGSHNTAPGMPQLLTPTNNSNPGTNQPVLVWNVPADAESDPLHFKVEIATDNGFATMIFGSPFESKTNSAGFSPTPPVAAGTGICSFSVPFILANGDYYWRVTAWDGSVYGSSSSVWKFTVTSTGVASMSGEIPGDYALYPNYPNPFNPTTTISYALPEAAHVQVQIFDVNGREVKRLVDQMCNVGVHSVVWNGTDEADQKVSSGIYICRFSAGELVFSRKLILAK